MALEGNVSLQRKIDALCEEGAKPVADRVAEAAADDYGARCVIVYGSADQAPGEIHAEEVHIYLGNHEFRSRKAGT